MPSVSMFQSPRYLVFRHAQRAIKKNVADPPDEALEPGQERLRSFDIPGMQAGPHTIEVQQPVSGDHQSTTLLTTQKFDVVAPRFSLPEDAIHTTYPPQGFAATAETLPHVFFNEPTFPWERVGSWDAEKSPPSDYSRNRTPWLAVFVFTEDELKLAEADLNGADSIFRDIPSLKDGAKQDSTFAVSVPVKELSNIVSTVNPYTSVAEDSTVATTVLLKRELFAALFSEYNSEGVVEPASTPYVYYHRFLAHKEIINTEGMAVSGATSVNDTGSFGAVVSCRSAPVPPNITAPTPVYVHLVSIEGVEQMDGWPLQADTRFVALVSLASWSYICLPPDTPNVRDELVQLGKTLAPLRPALSEGAEEKLNNNPPIGPRLLQRLEQGYAMSRYRVQSGDMTSCLVRGPFTPVAEYTLPDWFPKTSMVGSDLSILDRELGLMDISYAAAWQLGRTMAIADQSFTTSLYSVRVQIIQLATDATRDRYVSRYTWHKGQEALLADLRHSVNRLSLLPGADGLRENGSIRRRWDRKLAEPLDLSYHGPIVDALVDPDFNQAARDVASTPDPTNPTQPSDKPYDEYNAPFSVDWVVVLRWVLDRLFLDSIPAHYLLPDASSLPQESLRLFMIDDNWVNCFLDGALSLGNHIDQEGDKVRDAIKGAINWYLHSPTSVHAYFPPIPRYGCLIRSALISKFPDMIVKVEPAPTDDAAPILLRHEVIDKGTMLCLFSQPPSASTFTSLTFTQPPQQQSFVVGEKVTGSDLTMAYRRAYTVKDPADPDYSKPIEEVTWKRGEVPKDRSVMYLWNVTDPVSQSTVDLRMFLMDNFAPDYNAQLNLKMPPGYYSDETPSSALMAWQLSNLSYLLPITAPPGFKPPPVTRHPRALPVHRRVAPPLPPPPPSQKHGHRYLDKFPRLEDRPTRKHYVPQAAPNPMGRYARHYPTPRWISDRPSTLSGGPGVLFPAFEFFFWSAEAPGAPGNPGTIPMLRDMKEAPMAQDLIFSITIPAATRPDPSFLLEYIEIEIPQGNPAVGDSPDTLSATSLGGHLGTSNEPDVGTQGPLTTLYDGPGASMLSNLRFNPICTFSQNYNTLIIRLIPRSLGENGTIGTVPADRCNELSFLLAGVKATISSEEVTVVPRISIHYKNYNVQHPTQFPQPSMALKPVDY
ncbi:uncharacterized protein BP5553_08823 [Venustampulla echinocandica]|uniref:Uncharacterized protein n=1 Tax=Venustampulla echinocandica TaxID=2656787 RepID=A0A370TD37_9HELO|nr:uncharacterized protein BP5553_08823 [Venustampulla echinocandica]RDL32367.1 hypothetical protein BP5553_08823 [Venustampulla echinocandica]